MLQNVRIAIFDLVLALSEAVDLISSKISRHHYQVALIAMVIGREYGLDQSRLKSVVLASLLHDIGALSLKDKLDALEFEIKNPHKHSEIGYRLLASYGPLAFEAEIIRFHHVPWDRGKGSSFAQFQVPLESHIIHLSDRISTLMNDNDEILTKKNLICEKIANWNNKLFHPDLVAAFQAVSSKEYFWLDSFNPLKESFIMREIDVDTVILNMDELKDVAQLFSRIIDFRSRHTATHSKGVATVARHLALLTGFSEHEADMIEIAGYLHDLGKLAVPPEILDKPAPLTDRERDIINKHPFFSYRLIEKIGNLETIAQWASFHHETLDSQGYPFHLNGQNIPLGAKIMAVADIFTALMEDRPYRKGMEPREALTVIESLVTQKKLDAMVVGVLSRDFDTINALRLQEQEKAFIEYTEFEKGYNATVSSRETKK